MAIAGILPEELFGFQRSSQRFPCSFSGILSMRGIPYEIECFDISAQGVGIVSPLRLTLHSYVRINISLEGKELSLEGRVSWCSGQEGTWKAGIDLYRPIPHMVERLAQ